MTFLMMCITMNCVEFLKVQIYIFIGYIKSDFASSSRDFEPNEISRLKLFQIHVVNPHNYGRFLGFHLHDSGTQGR